MHRRKVFRVLGVVLVVCLALLVARDSYLHFTRWEPPPEGREVFRSQSPRGTWEVIVCDILYGGAAGGVAQRADIRETASGNQRLLYYDEPSSFEYEDSVRWQSDDVVVIAGHRLSAVDGRYDFRYDGPSWLRWGIIGGISLAVMAVGLTVVLVLTKTPRRGRC